MRIENRPDAVSFEEPSPPSRETVKRAQNHLLRAGFSLTKYGADGHAGRETTAAIARFQQAHALPVTGQLDAKDRVLESFEKTYLLEHLKAANGVVTRAAQRAGLPRQSVHRMLRRLGINTSDE